LDKWKKLNEKGEQCLSQHTLGNQPSNTFENILEQLKEVLDTMIDEYTSLVKTAGFEDSKGSNDNNRLPYELQLIRDCIDMFDQEYAVKESIKSVVSGEGFATQQHLAGCIALWKAESYLDEDTIEKIKELK
ncbi:hypothetical protein BDF20DRAFT_818611, partial [Mycotypha africana]|uniref:uncharacterized protein n=1 Tax=Mycotypha africana TaxID=64632 RepID=UPI00230027F0